MDHASFILEFFGYALMAFVVFLILEKPFIEALEKYGFRQKIREKAVDGKSAKNFRKLHKKKEGTPTGGGMIIVASILIVILFSRLLSLLGIIDQSILQRGEVYIPLFTLFTVGVLGAIDDWWNVRGIGKKKGIEAGPKFLFLIIFALIGSMWFFYKLEYTEISIPIYGKIEIGDIMTISIPSDEVPTQEMEESCSAIKNASQEVKEENLDLIKKCKKYDDFKIPLFFFLFFVFVVVGTANAVNVTDGLDGLAGGLLIQNYGIFAALSFLREQYFLAIFCGIIIACLLGFLWFNVPPAKFFMGDAGSLSLGATLAVIAIMTDTVAILPVIGFMFVVETISVIIQLSSKKYFKKKVFLIAPIHHHFEKLGWSEPQIVMRFWIINGLFAVCGFILELWDINMVNG
ncbi:MAG: phospho-N-acetylmuramoyl-pentapeptide-transferase [Minisyncoccales bacterium]